MKSNLRDHRVEVAALESRHGGADGVGGGRRGCHGAAATAAQDQIVVPFEHDVTGRISCTWGETGGRKPTEERRCAPTSVSLRRNQCSRSPESVFHFQRNTQYAGGAGMLSELKTRLADLERAARAAERRDEDLAGMVAGLNRAFGALCRVLEEDRPGTAARLLAALEEAADDPEESYSERVTEKMRSMPRVHSGVPAGHRQLHEPENRQDQVVNEPLVADVSRARRTRRSARSVLGWGRAASGFERRRASPRASPR